MRRLAVLACLALLAATARADVDTDFSAWLRELSRKAQARGVSATTFVAADGIAGRRFQKGAGLPVDGFVSHSLLERLRDSRADEGQATPVGMSLS